MNRFLTDLILALIGALVGALWGAGSTYLWLTKLFIF